MRDIKAYPFAFLLFDERVPRDSEQGVKVSKKESVRGVYQYPFFIPSGIFHVTECFIMSYGYWVLSTRR